jgi:hypothetical protein
VLGVLLSGLALVLLGVVLVLARGLQVDDRGGVEHGRVRTLDGPVHGRLEPFLEDDEVRVLEGRGLRDGQLEVVRLLTGLGEVLHRPLVACHPTRHPGQRVERRDSRATIPGSVGGPAATRKEEGRGEGRGKGEGSSGRQHENDSHLS